jgi:hypothetical protein
VQSFVPAFDSELLLDIPLCRASRCFNQVLLAKLGRNFDFDRFLEMAERFWLELQQRAIANCRHARQVFRVPPSPHICPKCKEESEGENEEQAAEIDTSRENRSENQSQPDYQKSGPVAWCLLTTVLKPMEGQNSKIFRVHLAVAVDIAGDGLFTDQSAKVGLACRFRAAVSPHIESAAVGAPILSLPPLGNGSHPMELYGFPASIQGLVTSSRIQL